MRALAIERGYDGEVVREPGAVFEAADGAKGSWFVACDEDGQPLKPLPPKVKRGQEVPGAGPKPSSAAPDLNAIEGKTMAQIAGGPRRD